MVDSISVFGMGICIFNVYICSLSLFIFMFNNSTYNSCGNTCETSHESRDRRLYEWYYKKRKNEEKPRLDSNLRPLNCDTDVLKPGALSSELTNSTVQTKKQTHYTIIFKLHVIFCSERYLKTTTKRHPYS